MKYMRNTKRIRTLEDIYHLAENKYVEVKKSENSFPNDALKSYSAFANTDGGFLILGVDEIKDQEFQVTGVSNPDKIIKELFDSLCNEKKVNFNLIDDDNIELTSINGKQILIIEVPMASYTQKPIYLNDNPYNCYYRLKSGDYKCTKDQVNQMIRDSQPNSFDSKPLATFNENDFDFPTIQKYRNIYSNNKPEHPFNSLSDSEFLEKIGALIPNRKYNNNLVPTVAGILVFGKYSAIREILPHFHLEYIDKIDVGITQDRWRDRIIYDGSWGEGNLFNFFYTCINKLYLTLKDSFRLDDSSVQRTQETPMRTAIREAFVNSIIHCDFQSTYGVKITRLNDRFEFCNGGVLRISKEDFFSGKFSEPRNHYVQEIFRHINLCERGGTGIPKIMDAVKYYSLTYPKLTILPNIIQFSIYDISIVESAYDLNESDKNILRFILNQKLVSRKDVQDKFNLTKNDAVKNLNRLLDKKYIKRIGKSSATKYALYDEKTEEEFYKYEVLNSLTDLQHQIRNL
ncbi:RNA-binding domain-containing protein [Peptoniphilus rhinitidis]|uniref:RNA-binding domain-containing protein n=2 Tax=Peptoniphilaceae TaxID=1570339 RepID=UPI002911DF5F|nr:RNA-binding domain-containing protein [Peptoniphilus rhinitidis]MDU5594387.1 putative DNA binding domain-containing protein [Peptoniphilus rhinitidis]